MRRRVPDGPHPNYDHLHGTTAGQLPRARRTGGRVVTRGYAVGMSGHLPQTWVFFDRIEPAYAFGRSGRMALTGDITSYGVYEAAHEVRWDEDLSRDVRTLHVVTDTSLRERTDADGERDLLSRWARGTYARSAYFHPPKRVLRNAADGHQVVTRPHIVGLMRRSQPGAGELARDIRHLLALAGLPECAPGNPAGRCHISTYGDRVKVSWSTESGFYDQAGTIGLGHPQHPMTRLDRTVISVMERALADVLYAAGFTVLLRPGIPNSDPEKERDPEVIVAAGPDFKAWAVLHRLGKSARRSRAATATGFEFRSPVANSGDAESYRPKAREAGAMVTSFTVRQQFTDGLSCRRAAIGGLLDNLFLPCSDPWLPLALG